LWSRLIMFMLVCKHSEADSVAVLVASPTTASTNSGIVYYKRKIEY
jgi:hypothetical protein